MNTTISVDIQGNDGKYDVWIATEGSSGSHYHDIDTAKIGEYTADLVDTLEESESGKSYLKSDKLQLPLNQDTDVSELVGQMIDIFEDFLEGKGTEPFPNKERTYDEKLEGKIDAVLYGSDYDALASSIKATFKSWGIIIRR